MLVFQDGRAFDVGASGLVAYLRALASGQPATLDEYGFEAGDYVGDLTQISPATARILRAALTSGALRSLGFMSALCEAKAPEAALHVPPSILVEAKVQAA